MSIRTRLFLAFLLTTLLVVTSMHFFTRWSLEQGFTEFVEKRQQERLDKIIEVLEEYYAEHQGWQALIGDKQHWIALLWHADPHRHRPPHWIIRRAKQEPDSWWPPTSPENAEGKRLPFSLRVMLLDANRTILFGQEPQRSQLTFFPIQYENKTVGFIGVLPGNPISQPADIYFMEQQFRYFFWIALAVILLSALVAWLLAYRLGQPLKRITAAARKLATGDYTTRLTVTSNDEIGRLALNFNDMAAALEQAEQSRRRWVADISHELRTPLAILRGEIEAVLDGVRPLTQETVESLSTDVMRLHRLTDDLYQLALSDQGALRYRKARIDPLPLLQEDVVSFTADFAQKQIHVTLRNQLNKPVYLYADADRLSQLFRNLLTNSLHHTDTGGQLEITIKHQQKQLAIIFSDSSPGISDENLAHLFDRFYQVDPARERHPGGAGLGLAICSNIVHAHEGMLAAFHSALGGLSIRISLPLTA